MPSKTDKVRQPDWAERGPNGEGPNLALTRVTPDPLTAEMLGGKYQPRAYVRMGGTEATQFDLPTRADGTADAALQKAGFWSSYAARIARRFPEYTLVKKKG